MRLPIWYRHGTSRLFSSQTAVVAASSVYEARTPLEKNVSEPSKQNEHWRPISLTYLPPKPRTPRAPMSSHNSPTDDLSMDELRDEYPSGWRILVQNESVGYILDALMDSLPGTEYTKSELATDAGVSRQSLYTHLDLLLALNVLEPVEDSSPQRYRVNADSELLSLLHQVNGTVNQQLSE